MGKSLNVATIIEFNGIPCSGKTTIAINLLKELDSVGLKVCNFSELFRQIKNNRCIILKSIIKSRTIHYKFLLLSLYYLIAQCRTISIKQVKIIMLAFVQFTILNYYYEKNCYDYIIVDQGNIQNIGSYFYDIKINNAEWVKGVYDDIFKHYKKYFIVNTVLDSNEIIKRLRLRKSNTCRLDGLEGQRLKNIIEIQKFNLEAIRNNFESKSNVKNISTDKTVSYLVNEVIEFIS